jgi:hypothetical protein
MAAADQAIPRGMIEVGDRIGGRDYAPSREQAMADSNARWDTR